MKKFLAIGMAAVALATTTQAQDYKNTSLSFYERAKDLVSRMTLDEKISQVGHQAPAISRLGVAGYNYWNEALHGVARSGLATSFPVSKAMSSTWDRQLIFDCATATSDEARIYNKNKNKGLIYWCPTINMSRDPRWGRDEEDYGEDPFLAGTLAVQYVKGMQGDDAIYYKTIATVKHFAANNYEAGRHNTSSDMDMRTLREYYLPAFEMAVKEANVRSVMSAYNAVNGVPCCCNHELLIDILRNEWGFNGFVTSDCGAIEDIFVRHKYVETGAEAAGLAIRNGEDLNCGSIFQQYCKEAIEKGYLTEAELDTALTRVLEARFSVGEFDSFQLVPYRTLADSLLDCHAHRALAYKAAQEAIVLLKNDAPQGSEKPLLPLSTDKTVALIGPMAANVILGGYSGSPVDLTTPLQAIAARMGVDDSDGRIEFEDCNTLSSNSHPVKEANGSGGNIGYISNGDWVSFDEIDFGTGKSKVEISSATQNQAGTVVRVYLDSRTKSAPDAQFTVTTTGNWSTYHTESFTVDASIFKGKHKVFFTFYTTNNFASNMDWIRFFNDDDVNPLQADGPLYFTSAGTVTSATDAQIAEAVALAKKADVVVMCLGTDLSVSDESHDRKELTLPGDQQRLLEAVFAANANVILVLETGFAMDISWASANVPAIVEAWYDGQAQGRAIADVLYGDYNPSGKLTTTWYNSVDELPQGMLEYDIRKNRYTYMYYDGTPLYPFGYGLSYTQFEYSGLTVSRDTLAKGEELKVAFDVTNVGERDGAEVAQLYVRAQSNLERPLKELKGFDRVEIPAGQTRHIEMTVPHEQLCYFNMGTNTYDVEEGNVEIMVGASSADIRLRDTIYTRHAVVKYTYISQPSALNKVHDKPQADAGALYNLSGQRIDVRSVQPNTIVVKK